MRMGSATLVLLAAAGMGRTVAQNLDYALRTTAALEADGRHNFGLGDGDAGSGETLFLNLAPRVLLQFDQAWTGYLRGRVFLPTRRVSPFNSSEPDYTAPAGAFAGLDEYWIQYNGFTSYPGEGVRIGRQHIRQADHEWWDQDADSLRWIFDTTLLSAEIGAARQLSTYRTDDAPLPLSQRNRTYLFADLAADWRAENRLGVRLVHALDSVRLPQMGEPIQPNAKLQDARLSWIGLYADNGFFDIPGTEQRFSYGFEISYLTGHQVVAQRGAGGIVASHLSQNVDAWQAGMELRWRALPRIPLLFGGGYTYSEGGEHGGHSQQYQQTGMQSNTSYFTGTRTLIHRYNATLQAQLGNLLVTTAFVSLSLASNDASLIFEKFRRDSGSTPFVSDNVIAVPVNNDRDVGRGLDLVFTHYLQRVRRRERLLDRGDAFTAQQRQSLISLHASVFDPGRAYGSGAGTDYRIFLEVTLWVD
jgi:alginate production protein